MKWSLLLFALTAPALAKSPTGGYAPGKVDCPSGSLVRNAHNLSESEAEWVAERNKVTDENLKHFLSESNMDDFDVDEFLSNTTDGRSIKIGVAFSGGGYRAMLAGAGQMAALDNRTRGANDKGLGGLLQASTYLTGLSGGNWLVGTIAVNNYTSVQDILDQDDIWDLSRSIVNMGGWNPIKIYNYYKNLGDTVDDKREAGYEVSLTDTWARALSHQFFPEESGYGADLLWSDIQDIEAFSNHEMPFPIVVSNGRTPGTKLISANSTVFETSPYELGSWDPSLHSFFQTKYLGTEAKEGKNNGTCVGGFDNAGFVMGTSSSLFNQFVLQINTTSLSSTVKSIISSILNSVSQDENDIAVYAPNPFYDVDNASYTSIVQNDTLYLVDGGEDGQNVPLYPLIQPVRDVDVIFAYDNSADTDASWPDGASLVKTFERQFEPQGEGSIFPYVPDVNSFINRNLTARPAFFGCDAKNLSSLLDDDMSDDDVYKSPLIVYTANRPFTYYANRSTFKLSYEDPEKYGMIKNGFEVASRLNMTLDDEWRACVGCAIVRREQERQGIEQTEQCKECFSRYCWDGTLDDRSPFVNFTTYGTTNGTEDNGNRTVSAATSLFATTSGSYGWLRMVGYSLLVAFVCSANI
ncbi:hypothetical protein FT663_05070 [Candidozyma haemuli var. vulneris]|uniref:Lysophospholipase n=1 Tax=Candidozyma haemuli TaxID=45357 RepID=A0A2V1APA7_9ASCO|nr:hypothetical protein CXQ85_003530 [[Candida] haemuloni]KAF3985992.1 hypothetical protein FT663_05070 [[Candida] haemuloni var. vulneris]KAF3986338.1 hypothetical protein FT662_04630 [[Candida] haemuloni var. vulneris]PVH19678.1 hypothetical protein CXQ85_003530 [[Candida] haemuloni]